MDSKVLWGITRKGILFRRAAGASPEVSGFVDSDFKCDLDRRRSITGVVFTICGGVIS